MKKKILYDYIQELLYGIQQHLLKYNNSQESENLHRIRVNIKKLKALLSFISYLNKKNAAIKQLKLLFLEAGAIREHQINRQILKAFPHPPKKLIAQLLNEENNMSKLFIQNEILYLKIIKQMQKKIELPEKWPSKKDLKHYFNLEQKKADKLLRNKDRESLHRYRMKLKKIMYIYEALPEKLQQQIKIDKISVDRQQEDLGDWHDVYAAIHFLSLYTLPKKSAESLLKLKEIEKNQFLHFSGS